MFCEGSLVFFVNGVLITKILHQLATIKCMYMHVNSVSTIINALNSVSTTQNFFTGIINYMNIYGCNT